MLFNSLQFAVFLPIVFALYWALPHRYRWPLLLAASYYFYMSWNPKYVVLIVFTTLVSYAAGLALEKTDRPGSRKAILCSTLAACLGVLFVFKYFNFFAISVSNAAGLFGLRIHPVTLKLLLPVGISFYTFQTLSYVIDVYRGEIAAEHNLGIYATFVSFFPQLVAGPIERTGNLLPQIRGEHVFDYEQAAYGLKLMAWGFFKKLAIADVISPFVDKAYGNLSGCTRYDLIMAVFFFSIQIYCDFSGYSDIAIGTAKLFGINLMTNFRSPYFSSSITELWKRWHISLSTWFRDYVYIPLGGNRAGKARRNVNLMVTFLVSGLWHGASWTYVVWGAVHGVMQVLESTFRRKKDKNGTGHTVSGMIRIVLVFVFWAAALGIFRSSSLDDAGVLFKGILLGSGNSGTFTHINLGIKKLAVFFAPIAVLGVYDYLNLRENVIERVSSWKAPVRWVLYILLVTGTFLYYSSFAVSNASFVYFQF